MAGEGERGAGVGRPGGCAGAAGAAGSAGPSVSLKPPLLSAPGHAAAAPPGGEDPRVQEYAEEVLHRWEELSEQIERQKQWVAERCEMVKAALMGRLENAQAELRDGISARVGEWQGTGRETQHLRRQLQHTAELVAELHQGAFRTAGGGPPP